MSPRKEIRFIVLENVSTTKPRCSLDQSMASSGNSKTAANQRDHSHHCIPSTARAVTPPKVGVISVTPCTTVCVPKVEGGVFDNLQTVAVVGVKTDKTIPLVVMLAQNLLAATFIGTPLDPILDHLPSSRHYAFSQGQFCNYCTINSQMS